MIPIKTERSLGTGFIVSSDGWIVTAAHVVIDPDTGQADKKIQVVLPGVNDGKPVDATLKSANDQFTRIHDFALLEVGWKNLPFLALGDEHKDLTSLGDDLTIIGFPFSVLNGAAIKFCLSASFAAPTGADTPVGKLDIIFFQGPSIKGVSGSPVISLATGKVVGIANLSLAGIGPALKEQERRVADSRQHMQITLGGVNFADAVGGILQVLDNQLANGLGAATGAKDAADKLAELQKQEAADAAKPAK
ncbi:MAG TPA: serine protease [Terriglobales bacterium]|nr:serine protease [Terriglobales bacterium]